MPPSQFEALKPSVKKVEMARRFRLTLDVERWLLYGGVWEFG